MTQNVLGASTSDIIDKFHDMVIDDKRKKVSEITSAVGISTEPVRNILCQHMDTTKLCARCDAIDVG